MEPVVALRRWLHWQLDPEAWTRPGLSPVNWIIFVLILVSITFGILATEPSFMRAAKDSVYLLDHAILAVFALEYIGRLATIGLNPRFRGPRGFVRYVLTPASIADLIVIVPIILAAPPTWTMAFRLLRILRLIRLASLPHFHQAIKEFAGALAAKRFELTMTACLAVILVVISSTVLFLLERDLQPEIFGSIPRAIWWSVVTFTTVGYGDAVPVSAWGRFFAGAFAISGIGLVAMLTGVIASALSDAARRHAENKNDE